MPTDQATDRAGDQDRGLPLAKAAKRLGVTENALRKRAQRGSVAAAKGADGLWYVFLDGQGGGQPECADLLQPQLITACGVPKTDVSETAGFWDGGHRRRGRPRHAGLRRRAFAGFCRRPQHCDTWPIFDPLRASRIVGSERRSWLAANPNRTPLQPLSS